MFSEDSSKPVDPRDIKNTGIPDTEMTSNGCPEESFLAMSTFDLNQNLSEIPNLLLRAFEQTKQGNPGVIYQSLIFINRVVHSTAKICPKWVNSNISLPSLLTMQDKGIQLEAIKLMNFVTSEDTKNEFIGLLDSVISIMKEYTTDEDIVYAVSIVNTLYDVLPFDLLPNLIEVFISVLIESTLNEVKHKIFCILERLLFNQNPVVIQFILNSDLPYQIMNNLSNFYQYTHIKAVKCLIYLKNNPHLVSKIICYHFVNLIRLLDDPDISFQVIKILAELSSRPEVLEAIDLSSHLEKLLSILNQPLERHYALVIIDSYLHIGKETDQLMIYQSNLVEILLNVIREDRYNRLKAIEMINDLLFKEKVDSSLTSIYVGIIKQISAESIGLRNICNQSLDAAEYSNRKASRNDPQFPSHLEIAPHHFTTPELNQFVINYSVNMIAQGIPNTNFALPILQNSALNTTEKTNETGFLTKTDNNNSLENRKDKIRKVRIKRQGIFPKSRILRKLKQSMKYKVRSDSSVYISAVLEYLTSELLSLSASQTRSCKRKIIQPLDIDRAIRSSRDFKELLHPWLLNKN